MNSIWPVPGRFAIENERTSSLPGIVMSAYWPGLKASASSPESTRRRMSLVSSSTASTRIDFVWSATPERSTSSS